MDDVQALYSAVRLSELGVEVRSPSLAVEAERMRQFAAAGGNRRMRRAAARAARRRRVA